METCSDYEIDSRFLAFCSDSFNGIDRCQYSMRALLNAVHQHQPDTIVSFGSEANLLAKLIKPTLRVPLICNNLPHELEYSGRVRKHIDKVTKTLTAHCNWSFNFEKNHTDYLPSNILVDPLPSRIAIVKSDPIGPVLANLAKQHDIDFIYINPDQSQIALNDAFSNVGFMIVSTDCDSNSVLSTIASSFGISTLYVGKTKPNKAHYICQEAYENATSTTDIKLIMKLKEWKKQSLIQKFNQAKLNQYNQSKNNGIIKFLDDLGFKQNQSAVNIGAFQNIS